MTCNLRSCRKCWSTTKRLDNVDEAWDIRLTSFHVKTVGQLYHWNLSRQVSVNVSEHQQYFIRVRHIFFIPNLDGSLCCGNVGTGVSAQRSAALLVRPVRGGLRTCQSSQDESNERSRLHAGWDQKRGLLHKTECSSVRVFNPYLPRGAQRAAFNSPVRKRQRQQDCDASVRCAGISLSPPSTSTSRAPGCGSEVTR